MNAGRSPSWIFRNHLKNQGSNFLAYRLATSPRLGSGKPFPIQPKTGTMPADNGSGCHLDERFLPSSPAPSQYDPEQLVCRSESPARALGVKSEQLLTQGKIFEDDILAGPECTNNPAEEVPEPYDHAQNLTGTLSIELGGKSLILRVSDVLMNDRREQSWRIHPGAAGAGGHVRFSPAEAAIHRGAHWRFRRSPGARATRQCRSSRRPKEAFRDCTRGVPLQSPQ